MSERLAWFPMYAGRFLTSRKVRQLNAEGVGVYILLLCEQWDGGPLPDDIKKLSSMVCSEEHVTQSVLDLCFTLAKRGWVNKRLEEIHKEQQAKADKRSRAGRVGAEARIAKQSLADAERPLSIREEKNRTEKNRREKKQKRALQQSWKPNDNHQIIAEGLALNLPAQVEAFRDHAAANGRLLVDWDAGFRTWLRKSKEWERPASPNFGNEDRRDADRTAAARSRESQESLETHEAGERAAAAQEVVHREYYTNLQQADQTRIDLEISERALTIWPSGKPPPAVVRGCFAAVISEQMQKGAA